MDTQKMQQAIDAGQKKATEMGFGVSIAIVDEYGDLLSFSRMPGALKISPKFAITKAYTAGTCGLATEDIAKYAGEGKPYYGVESLFGGELTTIAGGVPIMKSDKIIGGVGVGGSHDVSQDAEIAKIVVEALS